MRHSSLAFPRRARMRLFMPRRATPHRLRALFARSSVVARARFLPLTGMSPLPTFRPLLRLRSRVFSLPRFNRPRRPSRRLNPSKHKTLRRTISLRMGRRATLTNRARRAEALLAQVVRVALLADRAAARRRRVLRPPKKMSFTRFLLIGSINACSFLVACASLRGVCNTMPAWAISGMPRNGIPTCLFTTTRLTP